MKFTGNNERIFIQAQRDNSTDKLNAKEGSISINQTIYRMVLRDLGKRIILRLEYMTI